MYRVRIESRQTQEQTVARWKMVRLVGWPMLLAAYGIEDNVASIYSTIAKR
jgi:hypothetical protein